MRAKIAIALIIIIVYISLVYSSNKKDVSDVQHSWSAKNEPDYDTRSLVEGINSEDVDHLRLVGSGNSCLPEKGVEVYDELLIKEFITAIKKSVKPKGVDITLPGLRPDGLEIYLKKDRQSKSNNRDQKHFDICVLFFADVPPYTIGPDFQNALYHAGVSCENKNVTRFPSMIQKSMDDESER